MDKKVTILKPKRQRRPKGMRKVRVSRARTVTPKAPTGPINVFHYFPGISGGGGPAGAVSSGMSQLANGPQGLGIASMIPSNYIPPVMEEMRPNQARNDLIKEPAPEQDDIESQKTSNLLRSMEKQGMFGPPEAIPEGVIPLGFQPMLEPLSLASQTIPVQRMRDMPYASPPPPPPPPPVEVFGERTDYSNYTATDRIAIREHDRIKSIPKRDRTNAEQFLFERLPVLKRRSDYKDFIASDSYKLK